MDFGAAKVRMKPASPGTGVVAGGAVRPILELAGVRDVLAKSLGSPNAVNTAKATIKCFENLRVAERVAELRGKSLEEMVPWLVRKRREEAMAAGGEFGGPDVSGEEAEELVEAVEAE
jgi:small subunit ribosomal protein S5